MTTFALAKTLKDNKGLCLIGAAEERLSTYFKLETLLLATFKAQLNTAQPER